MKRFIMIVLISAALIFGVFYAVYQRGLYVNLSQDEYVQVPFRTEGKEIEIRNSDGEYVPMVLKGVDVLSRIPGHYRTEFAPDEKDYLRWFEDIGAMGANTIRAIEIMDDDFYNALYTYNTTHDKPLYLLQSIPVSDKENYGDDDGYGEDFQGKLIEEGRTSVDIIHGRKMVFVGAGLEGIKRYRRDISPWVVGYLVGAEWSGDTVAYTDHRTIHSKDYDGTYFSTTGESTSFEAMLAEVMDSIVDYETDKYNAQRPIGFINDPGNDFLVYEEVYARQLEKYSNINSEHIHGTKKLKSGQFAAYRLYDFCDNFSEYLSTDQQKELGDILNHLDTTGYYEGYLQLMAEYHTMPVLAAGYGFSSSRGKTEPDDDPLTEDEQGHKLVRVYHDAMKEGWSGMFISTWQDVWERRSWNTAFATDYKKGYLWHNLQSEGQSYGLMSFDPGETERISIIDGDLSEWTDDDKVLEKDDITVSARYDQQGLYIMIQGENVSPDNELYLPMDTIQESGSKVYKDLFLEFERGADFLLYLNGKEKSRLLVQDRYDPVRANFSQLITGSDPYIHYPEKDSSNFITQYMVVDNNNLVKDLNKLTPKERRQLIGLGKWETGRLTHGIGDPDSKDYNSLADFYYGENCIEIRLPWLLLNVGDPSDMVIHSDYYKNYGVDFEGISKMWLGITNGNEIAEMESFNLKGLGKNLKYHERLKRSYYVLQEEWYGGDTYGDDH